MGPFFIKLARLKIDASVDLHPTFPALKFYSNFLTTKALSTKTPCYPDRPVIKTALISEHSATKMLRK